MTPEPNPLFYIGPHPIGPGCPPVIIAEIGVNHDGDMDKARALLRSAAGCGAQIAKFQAHIAEAEMLPGGATADYVGEPLFDLIKRVSLTQEQMAELQALAKALDIVFMATPFSREAADQLETLDVPAYKIGSGEVTNIPLVRHVVRKGKPVILSSGMTTLDEMATTLNAVLPENPNIAVLHCTSTYPTTYEDVRLGGIGQLRERFGLPVGLSDHSPGVATGVASVALGASVIEKHFTLDRSWPGPDQAGSIEPHELAQLVRDADRVFRAMKPRGDVLDGERPVQDMARESLVTIAPVKKGEALSMDNLWVKRPGTGIPANALDSHLGRTVTKDLPAGHLLAPSDLA